MSVCPFEKIAVDELDRRVIRQLSWLFGKGRRAYDSYRSGLGILNAAGRGAARAGNMVAHSLQYVGDKLVQHPMKTLAIGVPATYGLYTFPGRVDRLMNNVSPEHIYQQ